MGRTGSDTTGPLQLGKAAEQAAARHLESLGYRLLARNYRTRFGEIDLVARQADTIVFVEVKARRSDRFGTPREAVGAQKQRRLVRAAQCYLKENGLQDERARFDVVAVDAASGRFRIEVLANAFELVG